MFPGLACDLAYELVCFIVLLLLSHAAKHLLSISEITIRCVSQLRASGNQLLNTVKREARSKFVVSDAQCIEAL